ncbi:hypothetical protein SAY87_000495 [Trapa incisa]|uniref:Protein BZR1 homolog n=1 Tax=Trapa incisa TaxID=236973 RepID=A0AAN7JG89_9MYRT|nr:hypothetical protein SAY87_000495 [Trapa incisa]
MERENNKRRERRRRAMSAKIFTGLRAFGNYKLPKHCDNNEVLKALCNEAGWSVEPDGTTYRKGCKPSDRVDLAGSSALVSPCSSFHPNSLSYNPSPSSNSQQAERNSLIPWIKNFSSASSSKFPQFYVSGGSISAPVTPPLSSPSCQSPQAKPNWENQSSHSPWGGKSHFLLPSSTPPSPGRQILPDPEWFAGLRIPQMSSTSPTISLISSNPFGFTGETSLAVGSGSRAWTPGQSRTYSPATEAGFDQTADIPISQAISDEFAFGSNNGPVKPWMGERIHEEPAPDDLELTLGVSKMR